MEVVLIGEQPKIAGIGTDGLRDISSLLAWGRQTDSPRSRRRCRYRAVGGAEGLGTLDESEQTEGRSVRPFDGGGLWPLTRESLLVARRREPTGQKDNRIDPSWCWVWSASPQCSIQGLDCAFSENLTEWKSIKDEQIQFIRWFVVI